MAVPRLIFPPVRSRADVDLVLDHLTVLPGSAGSKVSANRTFQISALDALTGDPVTPDPAHPAMLTMQYTDWEKGTIIEDTLRLYRWNGSAWQQENAAFDYTNNTVSASLPHLGVFALLGDTHRLWLPTLIRHSSVGYRASDGGTSCALQRFGRMKCAL